MNGRGSGRRQFLGAMLGGVALLLLGRAPRALADKNLNHGDKASFKSSCKQYGGEFLDSPKDKLTLCVWSDGSRTVCDSNGNDCENYPPPKPKPMVTGGILDQFSDLDGVTSIELMEPTDTAPQQNTPPATGTEGSPQSHEFRRRGGHGKRR